MNLSPPLTGLLFGRLTAMLTLLFILNSQALAQVYDAIDSVTVTPSSTGARVDIRFNSPTQYIGHTPKEMGRQLFIDVRHSGIASEALQYPQEQQLRLQPAASAPLSLVTYRSSGNNSANIELNFVSAVRFQVTQSSDFRGIIITLLSDAATVDKAPAVVASPQVENQAEALMKRAKVALIDERNFALAGSRYQQVLDLPENSRSREALEFLGLTYERQGLRAEAQRVYEGYLARYPAGEEGSERVGQRLMSLLTATQPEQQKLRLSKQQDAGWALSGSLSQDYLHDTITIDDGSSETTTSAVSSNLNLNAQHRNQGSDTRMRLAASHFHDTTGTTSSSSTNNDKVRLSSLYAEYRDREDNWWASAGRQRSNRDGVLNRFDGIKLGYGIVKNMEVTVVAGYPVESTADSLNTGRTFAGVALDLGPYADHWEFSLYGLEQQVDVLVDRRAVGSEVRYFNQDLTVLGMVDYDALYSELNIGMLLANWTLQNKTTISASADVRKLPTLTTSNALQGQLTPGGLVVDDIAQLRTLYSDDEIYQLARDRTAEATTLTLGLSRPLSESLRIASDLSMMSLSATPASGGVAATPSIDNEYALNLQMVGTGILNGDDLSTLGLRYATGSTTDATGIYVTSRLPLNQQWRIYPRMMVDQREWKAITQSELRVSPSVRIEYHRKNTQFDVALGGEWVSRDLPGGSESDTTLHGSIGYRFEF